MPQPRLDFSTPWDPNAFTVAPSGCPQARETSALAAVQNAPIRGSQNVQLMQLLEAAGEVGLSDLEIQQRTGWKRQTICVRRFDLRSRLEPATTRHEQNGRSYTRWRVSKN